MGKKLHQLGRYFFTHPWRVVVVWIVFFGLFSTGAVTQYKQPTNAITIPGTKADTTLQTMTRLFPDAGRGSARVVVQASHDKTIKDYAPAIETFVANAVTVDGVKAAVSPFVNTQSLSNDGKTAIIQLQLTEANGAVPEATTQAVEKKAAELRNAGLTTELGGDIIQKAPSEILGIGEVGGLIIALVVLYGVYRSIRLAGLSLVIALTTVMVAMAGLFMLSQMIAITATTPVLAVMLGLAVGIDYSLFIANKYQRLVRDGMKPDDAAARANGTAGNAVVFAATTVVIALAALSIVNIPFMAMMGLAGAATIALAGVVAVTLVPALLGLIAQRVQGTHKSAKAQSHKSRHRFAYAQVKMITHHPWLVLGVGLMIIAGIAWPIRDIQLGLPLDEYASKDSTERKAYDLVSTAFGKGYNTPLALVVEGVPKVTDAERDHVRAQLMDQYNQQVATETARVQSSIAARAAQVTTPEEYVALQQEIATQQAEGEAKQAAARAKIAVAVPELAKRLHLQTIANSLQKRSDIAAVVVGLATDDGSDGVLQIIPKGSDKETAQLIADLRREAVQKDLSTYSGLTYGVTGSTAMQDDINQKLASALPTYLALVIGLSLIILMVAFRSILIPLKATLGFVLSVLAMFGALVAVFQWGWFGIADAPGPIISFIPIIATGILFGLAMDYEFFLVSSMQEAYHDGVEPRKAVVEGFSHSSRVVVAAAIIMIAVFGGFIFNHDATIQAIGFTLAIGIFVDAFVVRLVLVPAVMWLVGEAMWWLPTWLDKVLPHISIEGEE